MRAVIALAFIACSAPAREPVIAGSAARTPVTSPAPRIGFANANFDVEGLPAVARSGELVVLDVRDNDSARGFPNLRLELRDRRDKRVDQIAVMTANEFEVLVPDGFKASRMLEQRMAAANKQLRELHETRELVAMKNYSTGDTFGRDYAIEGDGISVTFPDDNRLRVRTRDGKLLADVDGRAWIPANTGPRCAGCPPCVNEPFLGDVYKAPGIDVIIVEIRFTGTDTCWEPSAQLHVVPL